MCSALPELDFQELLRLLMSPSLQWLGFRVRSRASNLLSTLPPHRGICFCWTTWPCIPAVAQAMHEVGTQELCVELGLRNFSWLQDMWRVLEKAEGQVSQLEKRWGEGEGTRPKNLKGWVLIAVLPLISSMDLVTSVSEAKCPSLQNGVMEP